MLLLYTSSLPSSFPSYHFSPLSSAIINSSPLQEDVTGLDLASNFVWFADAGSPRVRMLSFSEFLHGDDPHMIEGAPFEHAYASPQGGAAGSTSTHWRELLNSVGEVRTLHANPSDRRLVVGANSLWVVDLREGGVEGAWRSLTPSPVPLGGVTHAEPLEGRNAGTNVVVSGHRSGSLCLWDVRARHSLVGGVGFGSYGFGGGSEVAGDGQLNVAVHSCPQCTGSRSRHSPIAVGCVRPLRRWGSSLLAVNHLDDTFFIRDVRMNCAELQSLRVSREAFEEERSRGRAKNKNPRAKFEFESRQERQPQFEKEKGGGKEKAEGAPGEFGGLHGVSEGEGSRKRRCHSGWTHSMTTHAGSDRERGREREGQTGDHRIFCDSVTVPSVPPLSSRLGGREGVEHCARASVVRELVGWVQAGEIRKFCTDPLERFLVAPCADGGVCVWDLERFLRSGRSAGNSVGLVHAGRQGSAVSVEEEPARLLGHMHRSNISEFGWSEHGQEIDRSTRLRFEFLGKCMVSLDGFLGGVEGAGGTREDPVDPDEGNARPGAPLNPPSRVFGSVRPAPLLLCPVKRLRKFVENYYRMRSWSGQTGHSSENFPTFGCVSHMGIQVLHTRPSGRFWC
uniref:Uncharacterized protein n=1 Tax=Chromera velia CCMP2878 TaxID=1169474 RepID=A0A0G4HLP6_9ALVE|eukprot:Cvel_7379.t1-p1 / transcript=Cvel_7379.t1 / gene=Cvel_7379 / organism=Chromera_velia_CCMP2878 / gene_product=hypothetical protein / transcript_product=hypothetical protein / location=Cvel_scaffold384:41789-43648(+) / protein_length=620 / sequence_SO=supercontig / SO=protein_coding / is_pseudo=false